ncbi:MAG TPA: hypothetical protein VKY27_11945 [Bacteriovoracaceae bacterium]|nr:hypothetical protein [Bacteriovoracaceae bacterium]
MRLSIFLITFFMTSHALALGIFGHISAPEGCAKKVMVWLSLDKEEYQERLLLMHTEVPVGGSYKFYTKPGQYQIRANDEAGCEFMSRIEVKDKDAEVHVRMVKK